jgi:hypothetical protein
VTAAVDPAVKQMARFVVMYDTPSDVEAFERHYNDVHIPLAKRYPGLQPAAADGRQHGVQAADLLAEFEGDASLPEDRFPLVEGGHLDRAGFRGPGLRGGPGIGVTVAAYVQVSAEGPDRVDLGAAGDGRDEYGCRDAEPVRGVGHGDAVVTPRRPRPPRRAVSRAGAGSRRRRAS